MWDFIQALLAIVLIDIVLSGDNAIVIGAASRKLPKELQKKAMLWGTVGAVVLRIAFAAAVVWLIKIPLLPAIGAILLMNIAYKLLVEQGGGHDVKEANTLKGAIKTIIVADAVMSLDNVLALSGVSHGHIGMISLGIVISVPFLLFASTIIMKLMDRFKVIMYVGSGILAYTAAGMFFHDKKIDAWFGLGEYAKIAGVVAAILVMGIGYLKNVRAAKTATPETQA
jgi:YjbE family integral membrane protein